MNEEEEEYQPLDIAYGTYSAPEVELAGGASGKEQDESVKGRVAEDSQAAELYLYERPQPAVSREASLLNSRPANAGQTGLEQPSLEEPAGSHGGGVSAFPYSAGGQAAWADVTLGEGLAERKKSEAGYAQGNFEAAKVGSQLEESQQQPFYVNAKQYYRIIKRRYARARLEENIRISRERKPYLHESRHKHAMRRPRGQGGRFLTVAEIEAMKAKESSESAQSSETTTPLPDSSKDSETQAPVITQQDTSQNKLPPLRKNEA